MLPYSILKQKPAPPPAEPVVWHTRANTQLQTPMIIQPKTKFINEGQSFRETQVNIRESKGSPIDLLGSTHVINSQKGEVKGFRVGEGSQTRQERMQRKIGLTNSFMVPVMPLAPEVKQIEQVRPPSQPSESGNPVLLKVHSEDEEDILEEGGIQSEVEENGGTAGRNRESFTHNIVNEEVKESEESRRRSGLLEIEMEASVQTVSSGRRMQLHRELGMFQKEKNQTDQLLLNQEELAVLRFNENKVTCPRYNFDVLLQLQAMRPASEQCINGHKDNTQEEDQNNIRIQISRSPRKHKIFSDKNSRVDHHEANSEYLDNSSEYECINHNMSSDNIRMEESEVYSVDYFRKQSEDSPANPNSLEVSKAALHQDVSGSGQIASVKQDESKLLLEGVKQQCEPENKEIKLKKDLADRNMLSPEMTGQQEHHYA